MHTLDEIPAELQPLYEDLQRALNGMQPLDPKRLRDATPAPWATPSHEPVEL